jgi:hypothetical protein
LGLAGNLDCATAAAVIAAWVGISNALLVEQAAAIRHPVQMTR